MGGELVAATAGTTVVSVASQQLLAVSDGTGPPVKYSPLQDAYVAASHISLLPCYRLRFKAAFVLLDFIRIGFSVSF